MPETSRIAVLVANGFDQTVWTDLQKNPLPNDLALISQGATLISGWLGQDWGHSFAADLLLAKAISADFSGLIIPGGQTSIARLLDDPHTPRFLRGFASQAKPIALCGEASLLLTTLPTVAPYRIAAPATCHQRLSQCGRVMSDQSLMVDQSIVSTSESGASTALVRSLVDLLCTEDLAKVA